MTDFDILGDIIMDGDTWPGDVTPGIMRDAFAKSKGDITLNINSGGGDVLAGLAMVETIRDARKRGRRITARVLGVAASMAGAVACACDEIIMGPSSYLMIHNPWGCAEGDAEALRKQADTLDKLKGTLIELYRTKFDMTSEELAALMDAETWLSGEQLEAMQTHGITVEKELAAAACITRHMFAKAPAGITKENGLMKIVKGQKVKAEEVEETKETKEQPTEVEVVEKPEEVEEVEEVEETEAHEATEELKKEVEEAKAQAPDPLEKEPEESKELKEAEEEKKRKGDKSPTDPGAAPHEEEEDSSSGESWDPDSSASPEYAKLVDTLMSVEAKRRDFQAKADKALAELKDLRQQYDKLKADSSAQLAKAAQDKRALEQRLARIAASTFGNDSVSTEAAETRSPCEILASIPPREREKWIKEHRALFE